MKIFVYHNIIRNYCSGDYYFIAVDRPDADIMASHFAAKQNKKVNNNRNYTIEWHKEGIKEHEIKRGFLPLNRIVMD